MSNIAIKVENLSKQYTIGHRREYDLRNAFSQKINQLFSRKRTNKEVFFALKDINFEVEKGEVLGIIGHNGSGKSTLLKILSRITEPSTGRFEIDGRVSSLLEVGTGFHPELSGRENIYLNGTILGMKHAEIKAKFDEIVAFSEVEKFIDTPVKHYSSGMKVRLAFSVAAHLEPEILIVDEVLAVGDILFQKKCLGKMDDVSRKEGRTILFVSHNLSAVNNLCHSGVLLDSGTSIEKKAIAQVISEYTNSLQTEENTTKKWNFSTAPGNKHIRILSMEVKSPESKLQFSTNEDISLAFTFTLLNQTSTQLDVTFHLINGDGILVFVGSTAFNIKKYFKESKIMANCIIPKHLLSKGIYTISKLFFIKDKKDILFEYHNNLIFELEVVSPTPFSLAKNTEGVINPNLKWTINTIQ